MIFANWVLPYHVQVVILTGSFSATESTISSTHHQDLSFTLNLERSNSTFNYPEQQWSFISNYAVTDYSGDYKISLVPCTAGPDQKYSDPPKCKWTIIGPRAPSAQGRHQLKGATSSRAPLAQGRH